jgi:hypothetical protein
VEGTRASPALTFGTTVLGMEKPSDFWSKSMLLPTNCRLRRYNLIQINSIHHSVQFYDLSSYSIIHCQPGH